MQLTPGNWNFETSTWTPYTWEDLGDAPINAVEATGSRAGERDSIPMFLTPFLGIDYVDLMTHRSSIAAYQASDLMVVLDVTTSFREEADTAKEAALEMLEQMRHFDLPENRIGLITFTGGAEVFATFKDPTEEYEEIVQQWSGDSTIPPQIDDTTCVPMLDENGAPHPSRWTCTGPQFLPGGGWNQPQIGHTTYPYHRGLSMCNLRDLEGDYAGWFFKRLSDANHPQYAPLAENVVPCGTGGGGTNPGSGLDLALDELAIHGTSASAWQIFLITDGQPTHGSPYNHNYDMWPSGYSDSPDGRKAFARAISDEICDKGVDLHALYYDEQLNGPFADFLENEVVCSPDQFLKAATKEELAALMTEVVSRRPVVFVQ